MDKNKALDKIAKCLRLAKSSNPHEAANALRHAQALMAKYSVTEAEVNGIDIGTQDVGFKERRKPTVPLYAQAVVSLVKKAMGVEPLFGTRFTGKHARLSVQYIGPTGRVAMAVHAHQVIMRAMHSAWEERTTKYLNPGNRLSFYLGWIQSVEQEVIDYGMPDEERAAIDSKMQVLYGKNLATARSRNHKIDDDSANAGYRAGSEFKLHRPMGTATKAITHS